MRDRQQRSAGHENAVSHRRGAATATGPARLRSPLPAWPKAPGRPNPAFSATEMAPLRQRTAICIGAMTLVSRAPRMTLPEERSIEIRRDRRRRNDPHLKKHATNDAEMALNWRSEKRCRGSRPRRAGEQVPILTTPYPESLQILRFSTRNLTRLTRLTPFRTRARMTRRRPPAGTIRAQGLDRVRRVRRVRFGHSAKAFGRSAQRTCRASGRAPPAGGLRHSAKNHGRVEDQPHGCEMSTKTPRATATNQPS